MDCCEAERPHLNKLNRFVRAVTKSKKLMAGQRGLGRWVVSAVLVKCLGLTAVSA
jgi:hypothetical protein